MRRRPVSNEATRVKTGQCPVSPSDEGKKPQSVSALGPPCCPRLRQPKSPERYQAIPRLLPRPKKDHSQFQKGATSIRERSKGPVPTPRDMAVNPSVEISGEPITRWRRSCDEIVRVAAVALADAIGDDGASGSGQANDRCIGRPRLQQLIHSCRRAFAFCRRRSIARLVRAGERRRPTIMRSCSSAAAAPDFKRKAGDRIAIDAGYTGHSAYAEAFTEGGNDFDLLFAGKDVHGLNPCLGKARSGDFRKTALNLLY